jgi:hypothetical protein
MQYVKYKLIKNGKGYIIPPEISKGTGNIFENSSNIIDIIFYGETEDVYVEKTLPKGIIAITTKEEIDAQTVKKQKDYLTELKSKLYVKYCDPYFYEALREKELGNNTKWNQYVARCLKIKAVTDIASIIPMASSSPIMSCEDDL